MKDSLLLTYAHDSNGNLIHVDDAQKGEKYFCPNCGADLLLRTSKIPQGEKYYKRKHFVHKGVNDNHCSESFLHKLFKEKCVEYIKEKISNREDLFFEWRCEQCNKNHKCNLLSNGVNVVAEHNLKKCKPDIAIFDINKNVVTVIEVIVTHRPEEYSLQYYNDNNIFCLQINVKDFSDCEKIAYKLSNPNKINLCPTPICEKCDGVKDSGKLIISNLLCENCNEEIKISAKVSVNKIFGPAYYNNNEIQYSSSMGCAFEKTINGVFYNKCPYCNKRVTPKKLSEYYLKNPIQLEEKNKCCECVYCDVKYATYGMRNKTN